MVFGYKKFRYFKNTNHTFIFEFIIPNESVEKKAATVSKPAS